MAGILEIEQLKKELSDMHVISQRIGLERSISEQYGIDPKTLKSTQGFMLAQRRLYGDFKANRMSLTKYNAGVQQLGTLYGGAAGQSGKLARSVNLQNLSWQSVTEGIGNAILKVGLWMVATTAVIGAIRKIQQSVQLWKDLEITLERIGITTSSVGDALHEFFDLTADVAIRMGMPIEQTLQGMDLALRATASYENQVQRTATAQLMLRDAAILGNIAGMQFNQAIDILVGSLRQTGMELDQGILLLDKWVAVAKQAAVSVNDLSQGFAIMSSAAASAGLTIDQVNGLIAALSEAVTLGPVQVGNAIRALMATLYNPGSIKTLQRFGIAVRDTTGEFRSFWEILTELSSMVVTGALSEEQILQIAKAAGAGQRRYAQFVALLKNWDSAVRVSTISANAQGDALAANERIVNTLTNAWDQFTAAQNKLFYTIGTKSGAIQDLTDLMQALAATFSFFAGMSEPLARSIKLVAQLTTSLLVLKVTLVMLTRFGIIAWASKLGLAMKPLIGLSGIAALGGLKGLAARGATQDVLGKWHAPSGGIAIPGGKTYTGGQFLPTAAMPMGRMDIAKGSWASVGRRISQGMIKPMHGKLAVGLGIVAGGLIAREIYKSNWAGIGGAVGGGVGMALGGPVGAAAGMAIGGAIAKVIHEVSIPFADRVAAALDKFVSDLPAEVSISVAKLREAVDFSKITLLPLEELLKGQEDAYETAIAGASEVLTKQERFYRFAKGMGSGLPIAGPAMELYASVFTKKNIEVSKQGLALLERAKQEAIDVAAAAGAHTTEYTKIAILAEEIRGDLGLQEAAELHIEEIKKRTLDLTMKERDELLSLASSAPIAHGVMLAQLQTYLPELAKQFESLYPTYEDFVILSPEAYAPLQEVLSTIVNTTQDINDANEKIAAGVVHLSSELGSTDTTLANITHQYEYWAQVQEWVATGAIQLSKYYKMLGLEGMDSVKAEALGLSIVNSRVQALKEAMEAQEKRVQLELQLVAVMGMGAERLEHMGQYIESGRLSFFGTEADMGKIQQLLNHYKGMLENYIQSEEELYHAFIKDERGVIQGFYQTFEAHPEVWQAMLGELRGIEENTTKMLEAEYNLPGWYQAPTRYWAIKTTGMKEGFGPAQTGFWELWEEFLAKQQYEPVTIPTVVDDTEAVNNLDNLNDTLDQTAASAAAATDNIAKVEPWAWYKWKPSSEMAQEPATEVETASKLSQILDWVLGIGAIINPYTAPFAALLSMKGLLGFQHGGVVPQTGPYYLHKNEVVSSVADIKETNVILSNSYRVLLVSQNYLSSINIGILGVRHELQQLRYETAKTKAAATSEFETVTRTGYAGVSTLGAR